VNKYLSKSWKDVLLASLCVLLLWLTVMEQQQLLETVFGSLDMGFV